MVLVIQIGLIKRQVIVVSYIQLDHTIKDLLSVKIIKRLLILQIDGSLVGVGGVNRNTIFGITCQMDDGKWVEWKGN